VEIRIGESMEFDLESTTVAVFFIILNFFDNKPDLHC
jgi:hypothetical protein